MIFLERLIDWCRSAFDLLGDCSGWLFRGRLTWRSIETLVHSLQRRKRWSTPDQRDIGSDISRIIDRLQITV